VTIELSNTDNHLQLGFRRTQFRPVSYECGTFSCQELALAAPGRCIAYFDSFKFKFNFFELLETSSVVMPSIPQLRPAGCSETSAVQERTGRGNGLGVGEEGAGVHRRKVPKVHARGAIDPRDLTIQGRLRVDPYRPGYIDDFSTIQPVIDKRPKRNPPPVANARFMNLDEFTQDLVEWANQLEPGDVTGNLKKLTDFVPEEFKNIPEKEWPRDVQTEAQVGYATYIETEASKKDAPNRPTDGDILEYILERSSMTDNNQPSNSSLAPALPRKTPGVVGLYTNASDPADEGLDDEGVYQELKRRTGMTVPEILAIKTVTLVVRWVSNQTRMGKIQTTSVLSIAGNGKGWLGLGVARSTEPNEAMGKSTRDAILKMKPVRRYEDRTIYGNVEGKMGSTRVQLFARPPGKDSPPLLLSKCFFIPLFPLTPVVT
jgi:Ribosomal protein S5, N-terminal domain